jgi:hypothetical protein
MTRPGLAAVQNTRRFAALLAALVALLVLFPLTDVPPLWGIVYPYRILFSIVLVSGSYAVSRQRGVFLAGLVLVTPTLVADWSSAYGRIGPFEWLAFGLQVVFLLFVTGVIVREVLAEERVSIDTILGGICVYLLIGIGYGVAYMGIEHAAPGSFTLGGIPIADLAASKGDVTRMGELLYYSFVTLTTLGYGDIVPASNLARSLAVSEAVAGSLFIAIFIAGLVGTHLSHASRRDRN